MKAAAAVRDGGVVLAGFTLGSWNAVNSKERADFAAAKLNSDGTVIWRWQVRNNNT